MEEAALKILDAQRLMTIATVRPDGWPQATIVGYANDGLLLYFLIYRTSQKFANTSVDKRVAITVGKEPAQLEDVRAVYAACNASEVTDLNERGRAWGLLAKRHPNLTDLAPPGTDEVATMVAECKFVSVLDYTKALGHTEEFAVDRPLRGAPD
jgi:nitroimidazol reductase NimA-like FMN-containing flavoprotein (pyridoxamine 5'-phosphate oxidase superfamily)